MTSQRVAVVLAALGLALGGVAACFSERAGTGPLGTAGCQVPIAVIDSGHVVVALRNFAFVPDSIAVPAGATVTWINCEDVGTEPHTTTADDGTTWNSPELAPGQRYTRTFPAPGTFPYHCEPHSFMQAKVVVQ